MANKPKFLKNLLTTASAITVAAISASSAMGAATRVITGTPANATGVNLDGAIPGGPAGTPAAAVFVGGSILQSNVNSAQYTHVIGVPIGGFNLNGKSGNTFTTSAAGAGIIALGPVADLVSNNQKLAITVTAGDTLSLNGVAAGGLSVNNYTGIGPITLGDSSVLDVAFATQGGPQAVIGDVVTNTVVGTAQVKINGKSDIYLSKGLVNIKGFTVEDGGKVQLGGTTTINNTVGDAGFTLTGAAELKIDAGATVTGTGNTNFSGITGVSNGTATPASGTLTFLGDGSGSVKTTTVDFTNGVGRAAGAAPTNADLSTINVGNVIVKPGANTKIVRTKDLVFNSTAAPANVTTAATGTTAATTTANPLANKAELALGAVKLDDITIANAISTTDGSGIISAKGADQIISVGKIGGDGSDATKLIQGFRFDSDHTIALVTFGSGVNGGNALPNSVLGIQGVKNNTGTDKKGTLWLGLGTNLTLVSDIGENGKSLKEIAILSSDGASNDAATVLLKDGKTIYAENVTLSVTGLNNILALGEGSKVVGNVRNNDGSAGTVANKGLISVKGNSEITGKIADKIAGIKFDVDGKVLKVGGSLLAFTPNATPVAGTAPTTYGVDFTTNGGTLMFTANNTDVTYDGETMIGAGKIAKLDASGIGAGKKFTIAQRVGIAAAPLAELKGTVGGTVVLSDASYITTIDATGGDGTIQLMGDQSSTTAEDALVNAVTYGIDNIKHDNEKTTLSVVGAVKLGDNNPSVLSTADNQLKALNFVSRAGTYTGIVFAKQAQLYVKEGVTTDATDNGGFVFSEGDNNIVSGDVGTSAKKLYGIILKDNVALELKGKIYLSEGVDIGENAKLTLSGSGETDIDDIAPVKDNSGILVFNNSKAAIEYKGNINDKVTDVTPATVPAQQQRNALAEIQFNGQDIKLTGNIYNGYGPTAVGATPTITTYTKLNFTNDKQAMTLDVTKAGAGILNNREIITAGNRIHNILVAGDQTLSKKIGDDNKVINLTLNDNSTFTVSATDIYAALKTANDGQGKVVVKVDGAKITSIGSPNKLFATAEFAENTELFGAAFVKQATLADGKTLKLRGIVGDTLAVNATTTNAIVVKDGKDSNVSSALTFKTANIVDVTFDGGAAINKDVGTSTNYAKSVNFNGDNSKTVVAAANIYSKVNKFGALNFTNTKPMSLGVISSNDGTVTANKTTYTVGADLTIHSAALADVTLNLNSSKLNVTGTSTATGVMNINTNAGAGNLVLANNDKFDASGVTTTNITVTIDRNNLPEGGSTYYIVDATKLSANGKYAPSTAAVNVNTVNSNFLQFKLLSNNTQGLLIGLDNVAEEYTRNLFKGADQSTTEAALVIIRPDSTGDAAKLRDVIEFASGPEAIKVVEQLIRSNSTATTEVINQNSQNVNQAVFNRGLGVNLSEIESSKTTALGGVAASGDESLRHGVWFTPFYNQSNQKARAGMAGYDAKTTGGMIGFDTLANDEVTIGVAATFTNTDIKHKNSLSGNKTKVGSVMFSVYGLQNFAENWFVEALASFGSSKVRVKENRLPNNEVATGKYDSMSYSGEMVAGYNFKAAEVGMIIPMGGFRYSKVTDSGYTETGTAFQNRTIGRKSTNKVDLVAGVRAEMFSTNYSGVDFAPEVHGFVNHDLIGKVAKLNINIDGLKAPLPHKGIKPVRTYFNAGFGLNAKSGIFEYGAGYDAQLANKFIGHTGYVKFRVNF